MFIPFEQLPAHSRLWVYQADREFSAEEAKIISQSLTEFCAQWTAHGNALSTSFKLEHNRFVILSVDETTAGASGCSIDGSVRNLKELGHHLNVDFFDRSHVAFLIDGKIEVHPLASLKFLFDEGRIKPTDITFNNFVTSKSEWASGWKASTQKSWLIKYLPKDALSA